MAEKNSGELLSSRDDAISEIGGWHPPLSLGKLGLKKCLASKFLWT